MYAVIETAGLQHRVTEGDVIRVPMLLSEPGKTVSIDKVLLIDGEKMQVGKPHVEGARIEATVLSQGKSDKVLIFKKKRRTKYRKTQGHRQDFTELRIEKIVAA